jgi:hypothetical protein
MKPGAGYFRSGNEIEETTPCGNPVRFPFRHRDRCSHGQESNLQALAGAGSNGVPSAFAAVLAPTDKNDKTLLLEL